MERFLIIVNSFQPLTITTKRFILDIAAVLDPSLKMLDLVDVLQGPIYAPEYLFKVKKKKAENNIQEPCS